MPFSKHSFLTKNFALLANPDQLNSQNLKKNSKKERNAAAE
jgi:hypothetical protein